MSEQAPPMCNDRPYVRPSRGYGESPFVYFVCVDRVTNPSIEAACTGSIHIGSTEVLCRCACHDTARKPVVSPWAAGPEPERRPVWWRRPEWVRRWAASATDDEGTPG